MSERSEKLELLKSIVTVVEVSPSVEELSSAGGAVSSSPELQASKTEIPNIDKTTGAQAVFKKSRLLFSMNHIYFIKYS
jgi:hypothetical protein